MNVVELETRSSSAPPAALWSTLAQWSPTSSPHWLRDVVVPRVRIVFRGGASTIRSNNANGPAQRISELNHNRTKQLNHNRTKQLMQESIQHYQRNAVQSGRLQQAVP